MSLLNLSPQARQGLLAAGMGMLGNSTGPNSGNAIGLGGMQGLQAYNAAMQNKQQQDQQLTDNQRRGMIDRQNAVNMGKRNEMLDFEYNQFKDQAAQEQTKRDAVTTMFTPMDGKGGQNANIPPMTAQEYYQRLQSSGVPGLAQEGMQGMMTYQTQEEQQQQTEADRQRQIDVQDRLFGLQQAKQEQTVNYQNRMVEAEKIDAARPDAKGEREHRNDFAKYRDAYKGISSNYQELMSAINKEGGIGDVAVIFKFMKALDPESVVRESEFELPATAGGVLQKMRSLLERYKNGDRLPSEVRDQISDLGADYMAIAGAKQAGYRAEYENSAKAYNYDVERTLGKPLQYNNFARPATTPSGVLSTPSGAPAMPTIDRSSIEAVLQSRQTMPNVRRR